MRKTLAMAAVALAALTTTTISASAWECQGPAYACNGAKSNKVSYKPSKKSVHRASHKSSKSAKTAHKSFKKSGHYAANGSGGGYSGKASYYWQPQRVASGGWFNPNAMTAAHKTLPFGTKVRVTNRNNGRSVVVTINDRGPYVAGRVIDLSRAAAQAISMTGAGVAPVTVAVLGRD
ncbi:MAG TPA: septal ring lytic transglycosylase RlpA family protein [Hyphomicrobium sp.]|nr:septal ring lytic transglycosylase RlpA family protein [Hyphomicrobium sp.]